MAKETAREKTSKKSGTGRITSLLIKQVIAAAICFTVMYGMSESNNTYLKNYASSLGRALRYDAKWEETTKTAAVWLKNRIFKAVEEEEEQNLPSGVTFQ